MKWIKFYESFSSGLLPVRELGSKEFKELINNHCKDFLEILKSIDYDIENGKKKFLFRKSADMGNLVYSKPESAGHNRISPYSNVGNYHNLILSNLESWKDYPKRNKSICVSDFGRTNIARGNLVYLVIPYDTTKIAISPSMDFWWAFKSLTKILGYKDRFRNISDDNGKINEWFKNIIDVISKETGDVISDVSWDSLRPYLDRKWNEFSKAKWRLPGAYNKSGRAPKYSYFPDYDKNLTLLDNFERVLDPKLHGFSIGYMKDIPNIFKDKCLECWLSDDCLMVKWELLSGKTMEEIRSQFE